MSSSSNNSSINQQYNNNSQQYTTNNQHYNGEGKCYCNERLVIRTSLTMKNPGRRFLGCVNFKKIYGCNYFEWVDPEPNQRTLEYARIMQGKKDQLERQVELLGRQKKQLEEENEALIIKITELTEQNFNLTAATNVAGQANVGSRKHSNSIPVVLVVVVIVCVISVLVSNAMNKRKPLYLAYVQ